MPSERKTKRLVIDGDPDARFPAPPDSAFDFEGEEREFKFDGDFSRVVNDGASFVRRKRLWKIQNVVSVGRR